MAVSGISNTGTLRRRAAQAPLPCLSLFLSLSSVNLFTPPYIHLYDSLYLSLSFSLFHYLLWTYFLSLHPIFMFLFALSLPLCLSLTHTRTHIPTYTVTNLYASFSHIVFCPSLFFPLSALTPSPLPPTIFPSPFLSSPYSLPLLLFTTHREQGVVLNV